MIQITPDTKALPTVESLQAELGTAHGEVERWRDLAQASAAEAEALREQLLGALDECERLRSQVVARWLGRPW